MKRQSYKLEGFISELQKFLHQIVGTVKPVQRIRKYGLNKKLIERLLFIEGELLHLNCQHSSKIVNIMTRYYNIMTLKPQPEISSHLVNGTRYCFFFLLFYVEGLLEYARYPSDSIWYSASTTIGGISEIKSLR